MFRRPSGSELNVPSTGVADEMKSTHPDHIGGYQVALPIFAGIESKFGLCLPKFQVVSSENMKK
jgi:solute carrier family 25 aspartate/glutamate transporter 12/13